MTPLSLHALMGLACALATEGEGIRSVELYQFVHGHSQTPAIYLEMAARWFPDLDVSDLAMESKTASEWNENRALKEMVVRVLLVSGTVSSKSSS